MATRKREAGDVAEGVAVAPSAPSAPATINTYHAPVTINNITKNITKNITNTITNNIKKTIVKKTVVKKTIAKKKTNKPTPSVVDGVRTKDGETPREWKCPRKGTPQTNVSHVSWYKRNSHNPWRVQRIDETGKMQYVGFAAASATNTGASSTPKRASSASSAMSHPTDATTPS